MKKVLLLPMVFLLLVAAKPTKIKSTTSSKDRIQGTWELVSHYIYDGKNITDTVVSSDGYRQIKMFYNGKVMWTRFVPEISAEWFGYGSYSTSSNRLQETLEYGSATMMKMMDSVGVFEFELIIDKDTYSQITLDDKGNRVHSENYVRID